MYIAKNEDTMDWIQLHAYLLLPSQSSRILTIKNHGQSPKTLDHWHHWHFKNRINVKLKQHHLIVLTF